MSKPPLQIREDGTFDLEEYRRIWKHLTDKERDWVMHKCRWEHMSRAAVLGNYSIPDDLETISVTPRKRSASE